MSTYLSDYLSGNSSSFQVCLFSISLFSFLSSLFVQLALYFCTGALQNEEEFRHYALNVPLYTHFTSPIRRYPDVIIHRLLAKTLGEPSMRTCNMRPAAQLLTPLSQRNGILT